MYNSEEFKIMLKALGLTYKGLASMLGLDYNSFKSMVAPSKDLPKWAVSMLIVYNSKKLEGNTVCVDGKMFKVEFKEA